MTTAHYTDESVRLYHGDCIEVMRQLPDASVDAVVTDPPYGLEFMGKEWDSYAPKDRKNASVWEGRRQAQDGWEEDAAARSGKGGGGPSYKSSHKGAKRCVICGKRAFSGSPCVCDEPEWIVEHRQEAPSAMIGFQKFSEAWAREAYRVLKPGGHLLAFGGTRTWHRLACAIEDAGFEVRDSIAWMYGSGFPKSLDVSKAMDKRRDDRDDVEAVRVWLNARRNEAGLTLSEINVRMGLASNGGGLASSWTTNNTTRAVPQWDQWLALKELIGFGDEMDAEVWRLNGRKGTPGEAWDQREVVGSKTAGMGSGKSFGMLQSEGQNADADKVLDITAPATPLARQWQGWGTALKPAFEPVVVARKPLIGTVAANVERYGTGALNIDGGRVGTDGGTKAANFVTKDDGRLVRWDEGHRGSRNEIEDIGKGRWPANVILDESQAEALDRQSGVSRDGVAVRHNGVKAGMYGPDLAVGSADLGYGGEGGASRFFYTAKADSSERPRVDGVAHPTVKPLDLMRYLVRLVTPPGGVVLEPFAGSGTTLEACIVEGFRCIGIEREADYIPLIMARITKPIEVTLL